MIRNDNCRQNCRQTALSSLPRSEFSLVELRGFEPRTEPGEMALELRFLSFGVVTRVLRFLRVCVGVLRDVTVLDQC